MNQPQLFDFEGNGVRTLNHDEQIWFAFVDVAGALEIKNPADAIKSLDEDEVHRFNLGSRSGETNFISEPGLYKFIGASRKPAAKRFNRWVTHDVLPTIRKHGAYMTPATIEKAILNPDFIIGLATQLKDERAKTAALTTDNEVMKPKALFADAVATSHTTILVGDLAKLLKQNGIEVGATRLFRWLREHGYLIKRQGSDWNMPTQKSMEKNLFGIKESSHLNGDGVNVTTKTPKVTGDGQQYFINGFLTGKLSID